MSDGERHGMSHHPAPHRARVALWESALGLIGGPLAWFVQLSVSYGLAAEPCYSGPERGFENHAGAGIVILYVACLAVALAGALVSLRIWRRTRSEKSGSTGDVFELGEGRTRFLALWGMLLGGGFAAVILLNGIALLGVPACAL